MPERGLMQWFPNLWSAAHNRVVRGRVHLLYENNQGFMALRCYIHAGGPQLVCSCKSGPWL